MTRIKKLMGTGAMAVLAAAAPVASSFATMTAWNVENYYAMPFTLTRVDYRTNEIVIALRGAVKHLNLVTLNWPSFSESQADQNYEAMREEPVEWGKMVYNGEVGDLPRNQEVKLPAAEGFWFYDDGVYIMYYAVVFADGGHYEGKIAYGAHCAQPLLNGGWDPDMMERVEYSDEDYECRVRYESGLMGLSDRDGSYMSAYTREKYVGNDMAVTSYVYGLARRGERFDALPADIKSLEQVADEERAAAEAAARAEEAAAAAAAEAERLAEEARLREEERLAAEAAREAAWEAERNGWAEEKEGWLNEKAEWESERNRWDSERAEWASEKAAWESERAEWESERNRWADEKAGWDAERSAWVEERAGWENERSRWASEKAEWEAERARWESEREGWASERAVWESEKTEWESEKAGWESEKAGWESEKAGWASEKAAWEAEKVVWEGKESAWEREKAEWGNEKARMVTEITALKERAEFAESELESAVERAERAEASASAESAGRVEMENKMRELEGKIAEAVERAEVAEKRAEELENTPAPEPEPLPQPEPEVIKEVVTEVEYVTNTNTVYRDVEVAGNCQGEGTQVTGAVASAEQVVAEKGKGDEKCEQAAEVPSLSSKTDEGRPWWLLIPVVVLATFVVCWWVLPEVRYSRASRGRAKKH